MAKRTKIKKVANAEIRAAKKFLESKVRRSGPISPLVQDPVQFYRHIHEAI